MEVMFLVIWYLMVLWFVIWLFLLLPARMATKRYRSSLVWILASVFLSPFVAILLLFLLGENRSLKGSTL